MRILTSLIVSLSLVGCATVTKEDFDKNNQAVKTHLYSLHVKACQNEVAWCVLVNSQEEDLSGLAMCEAYYTACEGQARKTLKMPKPKAK